MKCGQHIIFDENHHSGVYERVQEKMEKVHDIYENPDKYDEKTLEHHTSVALRELALEEVRRKKYPQFPSRMSCLYVSRTLKEAEQWGEFFARIGRPTYSIVKLDVKGNCFAGEAENLKLAEDYWKSGTDEKHQPKICEMLVDGDIVVVEIVKEINANIKLLR